MASLVGRVEDLVVEHGEVKGQTQTDGVGGGEVGLSNFSGALVGLEGSISGTLAAVADGKLGQVAVVIALPVTQILEGVIQQPGSRTSCGRRPWIRRSGQTGSGACPGPQGYHRRSWQARLQSFGGTP